jgi:hypothetical protein
VGDSTYGGQSILGLLPPNCDLTSRTTLDARLYEAPPPHKPGRPGRPRRRGQKLPPPKEMLSKGGRQIKLSVYGRTQTARVAEAEARLHAVPERPVKIVAVEALSGGRGREAFYSTVAEARAEDVLRWYSMRWSVEVTFHDSKQYLGFEEPQGWSERAVERTAPMAMLLYTLIVHWYVSEGHREARLRIPPWYTRKSRPSFADMLSALKRLSLQQRISASGLGRRGSKKMFQLLENLINLAA